MVSGFRAEQGLGPVKANPKLELAAERHAQDMARRGFFSHTGSNGSSVGKRARRAGYRFCVIAENIAKGQRSAAEAMRSWMASPGHRRNMLDRRIKEIGVARAPGNIWVMVLGAQLRTC
ncbi:CAP domain-containing protein [Rhodobacteraceae bacterium 63075]|nr:CAP domain-containing protein [Rhodobacteraceae bacterium 63075]